MDGGEVVSTNNTMQACRWFAAAFEPKAGGACRSSSTVNKDETKDKENFFETNGLHHDRLIATLRISISELGLVIHNTMHLITL